MSQQPPPNWPRDNGPPPKRHQQGNRRWTNQRNQQQQQQQQQEGSAHQRGQHRNNNNWRQAPRSLHHQQQRQRSPRRQFPLAAQAPAPTAAREVSDLPGFYFDHSTNKYYVIQPSGPWNTFGSTMQELNALAEQAQRDLQMKRPNPLAENRSIQCSLLPRMLRDLQLGGGRPPIRMLEEQRLRRINNAPSHRFSVRSAPSIFSPPGPVGGCQFLDVSRDGRHIISCWGAPPEMGRGGDGGGSQLVSYRIAIDGKEAQRSCAAADGMTHFSSSNTNTYGLLFESMENEISVDGHLVDMLMAPVDSDVTCLLFATANSFYDSGKISTMCQVELKPVDELVDEESKFSTTAPCYNAKWLTQEHIWSCSFNSSSMLIGIGMEKYGSVFNVMTNQSYKVSSGSKTVLAQQFSKDGNLLHLGRRNANLSLLDLRMSNNHGIGEFAGSRSACYIRQMEQQPNYVLTDNFNGELRLWDNRTRQCVVEFEGHTNTSHKVPIFVDAEERFVFAVGEDARARGWSLSTGGRLCDIPCPRPRRMDREACDFPRLVYSNQWGGVAGNSAVIMADSGELFVYELLM